MMKKKSSSQPRAATPPTQTRMLPATTSSGPITEQLPSVCNSFEAMFAECSAGMISTLAGPESRQNG